MTDAAGVRTGRLEDLAVVLEHEHPEVRSLVVRERRGHHAVVPWEQVGTFEPTGIVLRAGTPVADAAGEELHLARDVLDAQIVDVAGRRVRRVSDVELARSGDTLRAVAVDVGWVGIARRLGLGRLALGPRHDLVDWGDLHYLSFGSVIGVAALIVLIPGAPLISILFLTQALNAVLLLPLLWFIRGIAGDRLLMGEAAVGRVGAAASAVVLVLVSVSVALLLGLSL